MSKIIQIFKKEMLSFFRDKKALVTLFLPILIYPVFMIFLIGIMNVVESSNDQELLTLYVDESVSEQVIQFLDEDEMLELKRVTFDSEAIESIDYSEVEGYLSATGSDSLTNYTLNYHTSYDDSIRLFDEVETLFEDYAESQKLIKLESVNLADAYNEAVTIEHVDITGEGDSRIVSMLLGMVLPFIIVLYGIVGTNILSSDLSAGEKERATLETIFSVPVKRYEIITGKLLACTSVGLISGGINILSMFPLIILLSNSFGDVDINISFGLLIFLMFQLVPIMIMCSALFIGIGMFARTYQESQSYASVALIALMGLTYIFLIPDLEASTFIYALPITNAMMLMKEAFLGSYPWIFILQVFLINMGIAVASVFFMNFVFKNDRVMFGGDSR